jgi:hypothetical protein
MNQLILHNGIVELHSADGSLIRTFGTDNAIHADIRKDGAFVLITTNQGRVELRNHTNELIRIIDSQNAISAMFFGKYIAITTKEHNIELRKESGEFVRTV